MKDTMKRMIYLTVMFHLVLMLFGIIHVLVGCWGIVMQILYMACLLESTEMKTLIFIATGGTFLNRNNAKTCLILLLYIAVGFLFHKYLWYTFSTDANILRILTDPSFCTSAIWPCTKSLGLLLGCVWMVPLFFFLSWESAARSSPSETISKSESKFPNPLPKSSSGLFKICIVYWAQLKNELCSAQNNVIGNNILSGILSNPE